MRQGRGVFFADINEKLLGYLLYRHWNGASERRDDPVSLYEATSLEVVLVLQSAMNKSNVLSKRVDDTESTRMYVR
jgi:hypothetical protein